MMDSSTAPRALDASNDLTARRIRLGAISLAAGGIMFFLYEAVRPFTDTAQTMASTAWVASHLFAVGGFILTAAGLLGLHLALSGTHTERLAFRAVTTTWIGAGLTLPYYGAETFGLNVIAQRALTTNDPSLLELADEFRLGATPALMFAAGLVLLAVGAIMAAVAVWRSGTLQRWSGSLFATGFALFIPQFFIPQPVRIAHGLLMAAGALWLAMSVLRGRSPRVRS